MKKLLCVCIILMLSLVSVAFAQKTSKSYCLSAVEYTGTLDTLKAELLTAAKREAVREFFGEFISSFTKVENLRITEDTIQATSLGFVRIKGDPEYFNSQNLGEVCVTIAAYATEEDFAQFQPLTLTQKSCITEGDVTTIQEETEKKAIFDALINYDRRLESRSPKQVLPLLREVTFVDEGFVPETTIYCAKVTGIMYPVEVLGTLVADKATATKGSTDYTLDFTQYEIGDLPEELGSNLIVGETDKDEKYLISHSADVPGEVEIKNIQFSGNFEVHITGRWCSSEIILSGTGDEIIITYEGDNDVIFGSIRKDPNPVGRVCMGCCSDYVKLVVKGKKATLFIDDKLFGTVFVTPDAVYNTISIKGLSGSETVSGISGKNL